MSSIMKLVIKKSTTKGCTAGQQRDSASNEVAGDVKGKKNVGMKKRKQRKKKKTKVVEYSVKLVAVAREENVETSKSLEIAAANRVEMSDNIVLRKLLRGPRYFDSNESDWRSCYNCGEGGHTTVNCSSAKRKKPCFRCGSLEHHGKQCKKRRDCFICEKGGHRAKNCPEKHKRGSEISKKCLKCGDVSHDMFSCKNDYSSDDLKEIQCYICNRFGHLCCAAFGDIGPREPSCYRCGQLGHTGLECQRSHGEATSVGPLSSSFKCGEGGHFKQCTSSTKVHKTNVDLATPTPKFREENQETEGSMPSDSSKSQKRKRAQYEGGRFSTPSNSRWSGVCINKNSGDLERTHSQVPIWRYPVIPTYNAQVIPTYNAQVPGRGSPVIPTYNAVIPTYNAQVPGRGSPVIPTYNAQVPGRGSPVIPTYNAQVPGWGSPCVPTYIPQVPGWGSPITPTYNGNLVNTPMADGHASSSHLLRRAQELHFGPLASNISPIFHQNIYPGSTHSTHGNFSGYRMSNHR